MIGIGIILLPVFLIGLVPIGAAVFRIGGKMMRHKEETDKFMEDFDRQTEWELEEEERKNRKEDMTYLDPAKSQVWT